MLMRTMERPERLGNIVPRQTVEHPGIASVSLLFVRVNEGNKISIQDEAFPIYQRNLHRSPMQTSHRLEGKLEPGAIAGFAIDLRGVTVGVTAYRLVQTRGLLVACVETTVIEEYFQGKHIARDMAEAIMNGAATAVADGDIELVSAEEYILDGLTARTPRAAALVAKRRTRLVVEDYPTGRNYPARFREPLVEAIGPEIFDREKRLRANLTNGLWKNAYPFEEGRDLEPDPKISRETWEVDQTWKSERIGMDPINKDAVQYWCVIDKREAGSSLREQRKRQQQVLQMGFLAT